MALQQQIALQQQAAARAAGQTAVSSGVSQQRTAALQAALQRTNALLAAQQSNPALYSLQLQQQNPMVLALLERQAALQSALQTGGR